VERQLIDLMAQPQTAQLHWLSILTLRSSTGSQRQHALSQWDPLTVSDAEAREEAAAMLERFHGIFLRTLRALCALRKVPPAVVVQNAGQVNIGGQQVNVNSTGTRSPHQTPREQEVRGPLPRHGQEPRVVCEVVPPPLESCDSSLAL
jgi:hypothetical protein